MYNIKFYKGALGEEQFIREEKSKIIPRKGDIVGLEIGDETTCFDVLATLINYDKEFLNDGEVHEVDVFLKEYVWPF